MRWAAAWQCPAPRPEKGSQYNYSCKQVSTDRGQCRPPTPEEGRDTAVEIAGLTAATVASVLALPAVITNPAIASTAFRIVRIGNAAYAINNAANECQSFESMTNDEKIKCALAAGYAVTATVDGGLAGAGLVTKGSALLSGIEVGNDVVNLALGGVNAYNQCQGGTDRDCYYALISSGIDLVALGIDINQAKQWSRANLNVKIETLHGEALEMNKNYDLALAGDRNAFDSLPDDLKVSAINKAHTLALLEDAEFDYNLAVGGDRLAFNRLPDDLKKLVVNASFDEAVHHYFDYVDKGVYWNAANFRDEKAFNTLPTYWQNNIIEYSYSEALYAGKIIDQKNIDLARTGDRGAFLRLNLEQQRGVIAYLQRHGLYENWIKGYSPNELADINNIQFNLLKNLDWNEKISPDDVGMKIVLKNVDDIAINKTGKDSTKLTPEELSDALYERNHNIEGYGIAGSPNDSWTNNNNYEWRAEGGAELGQSFTPDCPGNVCSQNAMMLHISLSQHGFESQWLSVNFKKNGIQTGHAVVISGGKIYDPTWGRSWDSEEEWLKTLAKDGIRTDIFVDSRIEITTPITVK